MAKPGSTAIRLVVGCGGVNKKPWNHSGRIQNMQNTLDGIATWQFQTKMNKRSGFWQVDLTRAAPDLLPFEPLTALSSAGRPCPSRSRMPLQRKLYILRRRPFGQELISRRAEIEAHIQDFSLITNTRDGPILLLRDFFTVCQENHVRIKLQKCEFMREEMEYLGFDVWYAWWKPTASEVATPAIYADA